MLKEFKKNIGLHFIYCVSILLATIILLATKEWTNLGDFNSYLSNSATMVSLVLGLVAIVYSFITTTGLEQSLGEITAASKDFRESRAQISDYLKLAEAQTEKIQASREGLEHASTEVSTTISSLQETLGRVSAQNDNLVQIVKTFEDHFEEIGHKFNELGSRVDARASADKPRTKNAADLRPADNSFVDEFLAISPLSCNLLTYACVLACQTKKQLSLSDFCNAIKANLRNMAGFLTCMNATGLIKRRLVPEKPLTYEIDTVHQRLETQTKSEFTEYIKGMTSGDKTIWLEKLKAVDTLFYS